MSTALFVCMSVYDHDTHINLRAEGGIGAVLQLALVVRGVADTEAC